MTSYIKTLKDFDKQVLFEFKEKTIITDLYQYYFFNGFHNILTEKIIRLLISYLLIFIINLVINCINYKALLSLSNDTITIKREHNYIYNYIELQNWFPKNPYLIICFVLYCIYLFSITINCIGTIRKFWKIRKIYNKYLNINDYRLKFITWDDIISQITQRLKPNDILDTTNINIYTINNKICQQSNIIIALLRSNFITLPKLSKFLEWNFIFCIIDPMTSIKNNMQHQHTQQTQEIYNIYNQNLDETNEDIILEDIHNLDNKKIYKNYMPNNNTTGYKYDEPLLPIHHTDNTDNTNNNNITNLTNITNIINDIEHPKIEYNLDNISLSSTPSQETSLLSPTPTSRITSRTTSRYITNSIINENKFDDALYNTFLNQSVNNTEITQYTEYIRKVRYRITLAFAINLIAMPFTIIILLMYLIIKYGEKMYINPSILFQRQLNIKSRWQLRYYNELPNLFKDRIFRIERNMDKIINSYYSPMGQIIYRFLIFAIGSVFIVLLAISFIASETFSELEIFHGHNIIWFLGVSGTLLIVLNKCITNEDKKLTKTEQITAFEELREDLVSINPHILKTEDREYLVNLIQNIYQSRITHIFNEVWYLFASPYYLWIWKRDISMHCNQILELLDNHYILGNVCKYSIFSNLEEMQSNPHMLLSLKEFHNNHKWNLPNLMQYDFTMQNSVLLQSKLFT
jgi:hypothetical protein